MTAMITNNKEILDRLSDYLDGETLDFAQVIGDVVFCAKGLAEMDLETFIAGIRTIWASMEIFGDLQ